MIIVPILLPILAIFHFGGFHSLSPKAPKGVFEKNEKVLKTPLSLHISHKKSMLSFLKLFIFFKNTFLDFRNNLHYVVACCVFPYTSNQTIKSNINIEKLNCPLLKWAYFPIQFPPSRAQWWWHFWGCLPQSTTLVCLRPSEPQFQRQSRKPNR
mgnify:CR=1 FL=1